MSRLDRFRAPQVDSETLKKNGKIAPDCRELWHRISGVELRKLGVWHRMLGVWHDLLGVWHDLLGVWHAMLDVWHSMLGAWHEILDVWLRYWGNPHFPPEKGKIRNHSHFSQDVEHVGHEGYEGH